MVKISPEKIAELKERFAGAVREANPEFVIGVDEVGFGSIGGPLVIGAVGVPVDWIPPGGLTDSKELSRKQIERLAGDFFKKVDGPPYDLKYALIWSSPEDIDRNGLGVMRRLSMNRAIGAIRELYESYVHPREPPQTLAIVDGNLNIEDSVSIPKADLVVPVVSMASVIAKYTRDRHMIEMAKKYPGYGFEFHVGYDTTAHREALQKLGPCPLHRMSTATLKNLTI